MLEFVLGPKDPTKVWQRASDLRLTFDLEGGKLNDVGIGESLNRLSFLGPIEDRSGLTLGEYRFFSLGLSIDCYNEQDTIDCFEIVQKDQDMPEHQPFAGVCRYKGENLDLGQLTEPSFVGRFGPPFWKDADDEEILLFYEFPGREWQVEFALDGTLNRILVTSKPLMANQRQREAYGVNKSWPPPQ